MSNGRQSPIGGTFEEIGEDVVEPVKDAVGEMIEQAVQSVKAQPQTPQQQQQKQLEDQNNLAEVRRKLKWHQDLSASQKKIREQEKQKKMQQEQQEEEKKKMEESQKKQVVIIPAGKRQPGTPIREDIARSRQEIGKGHGVGG